MTTNKKWLRLVALFAALALVAAACGGDDSSEDATTTTTVADSGSGDTTTTTATETTLPPVDLSESLSGLTVVDDRTFTVELVDADPEFPVQLSYTAFFPLPEVAYENTFGYNQAPIGNGPYMFPEGGKWENDKAIDLVVNPNYAGTAPANDGVNFQISSSVATNYLEALDGNLDVLTGIDSDRLAAAPTDFPDRFAQSPNTGILYMAFPAYLDDTFTKEHRQALSMAIDRELIIEKIFNNSGIAAHSVVPSNLGGRTDVCPSWNYEPEMAKQIWDAAGPLDGFEVTYNAGSDHEDWIEAVVNMWDNTLGLDSSSVTFDGVAVWGDYLELGDNGLHSGPFRLGWGMDYPSPLNFLEPLYASYMTAADGGSNASFHDDPAFDALLAEGKAAIAASGDLEAAVPFYEAAEDLLCDEARTMPIRFSLNQFVWNEGVENVYMDAFGNVGLSLISADDGIVSLDINEPGSLIPMDANESEGTQVLQEGLFTALVKFRPDTGEMYMANAESITSDDGGKTWTIVLREGWTWHNGEPVTAQNYVDAWSYGARSALGFQNNGFYKRFVGYDELNAG